MIHIEKATIQDAKLIADLGIDSFLESHGHSAPPSDIQSYILVHFAMPAVEEELQNPENIFHILYYQEQAAGYSKIILDSPHPLIKPNQVTKLERLYLLEKFYGMQLGTTLFNCISELAKKSNQSGMWLNVWTENKPAVSFYKKMGFKIIGNTFFRISETHANPNYTMYLKYEN